ncbi:MAG TPA: amino acid permease [Chitinophagaceae bacterium]|nr:amino acid permease [Chitinophagaceae bacterium]
MPAPPTFKRTIGLSTATAVIITTIIGSGIFMRPAEMAALLGSPILIFAVWIIAGLFTMFSTMVLAEIAAMLPDTGGPYAFMRHMYGNFWAYLYGWAAFAVINCAGSAGIAFVTAQYFEFFFKLPRFTPEIEQSIILHIPLVGDLLPLHDFGVKMLTVIILCIFTFVSYRSTKSSGILMNIFSAAKVAAIVLLVGGLFVSGKGSFSNFSQASEIIKPAGFALVTALVAACNGALQAFDGCNNMLYMAGEIKNPSRNIPKSLFIGLSACIVIYLLINAAMIYVLPVDKMAGSSLVASDAATIAFGVIGGGMIAFLISFSVLGTTASNVFTSPRMTFAMAQDGQFFRMAAKVHPKYQTPGNALLVHLGLMIVMVLSGSFFILADMYIFIVWAFNLMMMIGLFILRKKMPGKERPYRVWGYPWVPIIIILFNAFYLIITLVDDIQNYIEGKTRLMNSVFGIVVTAAGIPLCYYFRWRYKKRTDTGASKPA